MQLSQLSLLALILLVGCKPVPEYSIEDKPNFLFILVDDLGYYDLSVNGSSYYETPHIDQLAKSSITFANGYSCSQVCSPSRASIMLGQFTARHGITDWIGAKAGVEWREKNRHSKLLPPEYNRKLPDKETTMAEAFKNNGYHTFFAGKWHLGNDGSFPQDHGFDVNVGGWESGSPRGGYFSPFQNPSLEDNFPGQNLSNRLAQETNQYLIKKAKDEEPFFAFLSFYAVHGPIQTTQEKWIKYQQKAASHTPPDQGFKMGRFLPIRQVQDNPIYAGLVESMDESVGMIMSTLDSLGLDENTIVVFTSDNGGVVSGDNYSTSSLPLRGGKGYQFEGGILQPYYLRIPNTKASIIETPVTAADFYPTFLDLAGLPLLAEQHLDGTSLKPLINQEPIENRDLFWHYPHYGNQGGEPSSIIRSGKWKLIHYYEDDHNELYNLELDPTEQKSLVLKEKDLADSLERKLFTFLDKVGAKRPMPDPIYDPTEEVLVIKRASTTKLNQLEKARKEMLSPSFIPNPDWWGSHVLKTTD